MTHRRFLIAVVFISFTAFPSVAQMPRPLPSLHVEGRNMVDRHGNKVLLHGVMDNLIPISMAEDGVGILMTAAFRPV